MHITEMFSSPKKEDNDSGQGFRFDKSLQELRDLRSQLHYAADYCETTFLNSEEKKTVVENTKEYLCKAVVTFVDHLGNVSANLNHFISQTNSFSEAELRINCLHHRLLSCQQFAHKLALTSVKWNPILPRHNRRYLSAPTLAAVEKSNENPRATISAIPGKLGNKHELDTEGVPLFFFTCTDKPSLSKSPSLKSNCDESDSDSTLGKTKKQKQKQKKGHIFVNQKCLHFFSLMGNFFSQCLSVMGSRCYQRVQILHSISSKEIKNMDAKACIENHCRVLISYLSFDGQEDQLLDKKPERENLCVSFRTACF
ncbi:hypothetical protein J1N35_032658 [Gossypium stocksii]|uniref:Protein ABIL5 n=1 Tax=Gossypium stocksii TaxID=47602 RepID=A0A9D3ZUX8_9ROSI|nr:hypothetical protein J1N35_032658 [Gossypium stocksii]